jgi:recombination protein RecA
VPPRARAAVKKTAAPVEKPKRKTLAQIAAEINKEHGDATAVRASEIPPTQRITTGSLAYDVALGGGWPINHIHEIIGESSHGKTATLLKMVAANQAADKDWLTMWIASEWFDNSHATMCGVDLSRVLVVNENIMETGFQITLDELDKQTVDGIVIDSLPAMTPGEEAEKLMDDWQMGLGARITNKFLRKTGNAGKRAITGGDRPCTIWIVNQWRDKIGVLFGDPRTKPGGKMLNFSRFTASEITRDDWIKIGPRNAQVNVGQKIKVRITKNKSFPPQKVATFDFYFEDTDEHDAGEYDLLKEIVGLGIVYGVVEGTGWYSYGGIKVQGAPAMLDAMREAPDVASLLRADVLSLATSGAKMHAIVEEPPEIVAPPRTTSVRSSGKRVVTRRG